MWTRNPAATSTGWTTRSSATVSRRHVQRFANRLGLRSKNSGANNAWAFATRCHPGSGEVLFSQTKLGEWVAYLDSSEKLTGRGGQALYNCLTHEQAIGRPLPEIISFEGAYPKALQERILANQAEILSR